MFMVITGKHFFRALIMFSVGVVVMLLAKSSVASYWTAQGTPPFFAHSADLAGVEVGLIAAVGVYKGWDGVRVVIGVCIGLFVAHLFSGIDALNKPEVEGVWYSIWTIGFAYVFYAEKLDFAFAIVSPIVGGVFASSSLFFFISEFFTMKVEDGCEDGFLADFGKSHGIMNPQCGDWFDFMSLLIGAPGPDVGVWSVKGAKRDPRSIPFDQLVMGFLWVLFAIVGMAVQWKSSKKGLDRRRKGRTSTSSSTKAREPLAESLIHDDEYAVA